MKIRLIDVAARAGVAVNTASTILNRRPNSWASKETEARVFKAAEDLGYTPNRAAMSLRSGKYNTLGLLIPDLHNPFYTAFADLLEVAAELRGYDVIVESWRTNLEREKHCLQDLVHRQIDGMAAFLSDCAPHEEFLADQCRKRRPFVALAGVVGSALPVDSVLVDFSAGLRQAVNVLYDQGHRQFVFLCALAEGQEDGDRPKLFAKLLLEKGIPASGFVRCGPTIESAHAAALELFQNGAAPRPTAMIALNDLSAIGAIRAASECGIRIPADLSVVGVDNIPLARFLPVSLATIGQPIEQMALKTVALLVERIESPAKLDIEQVVFAANFIPRESIGAAPHCH